ncbi:Uncharacterised protein [Citrobacter koseri]|uniref:Uncharacterized protein n=1 Tax=Citrobacter koseri TaxID=545 RepID=A0A3S5DP96_CITKO|nr:Uncharacterised protein [Citrobacter koseri]
MAPELSRNRQDFACVTGGRGERYVQHAGFKSQHRAARHIAVTQLKDFFQHRTDFALNQFDFLFYGRARREFLVADHIEHLARGFKPLGVCGGRWDTEGFVRTLWITLVAPDIPATAAPQEIMANALDSSSGKPPIPLVEDGAQFVIIKAVVLEIFVDSSRSD